MEWNRVLEPEVMDSEEEARDYNSMDHGEVNRAFVADFLARRPDLRHVLDLGTGTAQIPLELCRVDSSARVTAVDLAERMLAVAEENVSAAGREQSIRLQRCDAKALPFPDGSFTAAISNSIVHHIPEPLPVLQELWRVTEPGGCIFVRDLLRPDDEAQWQQLVETYAADANSHQRRMFADSLRAALSLPEIKHLVAELGDDPNNVVQSTDRHWTWATRRTA